MPMPDADLAAELARLIAHPTIAGAGDAPFEELHATLRALYPRLHDSCELTRVGRYGLLFRWPGTDPDAEALVLMAHQDVVPVKGQPWTSDPFTARIVDGHLVGRGAIDDKGMLLAICRAVEDLLAAGFVPRRDVWLLFGDDEEVAGTTAQAAADVLRARGVRPWLVLDEGGAVVEPGVLPGVAVPAAMIGVAEKGLATVRLTTSDAGGHASTPHRRGATARIARAVLRAERHPFPARLAGPTRAMLTALGVHAPLPLRALYTRADALAPAFARALVALGPETAAIARTTVAVTQLSGSAAPNVLATRAEAVLNLRLDTATTVADAVAHLRRVVRDPSITLSVEDADEASAVSRTDDDRWALLTEVVGAVFPDAVPAPYVQNGATDARRFSGWCEHVYRFAPLRLSDADRARLHAADERVAVATLAEGVRFVTTLLRRAAA